MTKLADVLQANQLLVALGGEDQMQRIAAASIEKQLELQNRIDRALHYAAQTPVNSTHARQIARILDGSITIDDELNEVEEHDRPIPRLALHQPAQEPSVVAPQALPQAAGAPAPQPVKRKRKSPPPARSGLAGRSSQQRKEFRQWADAQGYDVPKQGPVAVELVQEYDDAMAAERRRRAEERKAVREGQLPMG